MRVQQDAAPQSRVMAAAAAGGRDQFPIGMRVLAVDDDPVCLKLLDTLLKRCQYHVTTTNQAAKALALLRENKEMFDLVISDVHMPDMDGFKLLEQVGLEMDLPVIMLSANGETKTVMKGITHGACDYLLKPVRLEELKNIWQHVLRRRFSNRERGHNLATEDPDSEKLLNSNQPHSQGQNGQNSSLENNSARYSKKRKDQNELLEDEDGEDNGLENDEPDLSTQKKPRVVWSVELHRKFVAAVNQLGIDKAVPKRILELMNVEKLTRENVASHLQKYRLYLKRLSAVASQQASLAAAFGARDPSYLRMNMFEGLQSYHQIPPSLSSFQASGGSLLNRGNSGTLGLPILSPSLPNNKFQLVNLPGNNNNNNHVSILNDQLPNELSFSNIANNNNALLTQTCRGGSFHANPIPYENKCLTKAENQSLEIPSSSNDIMMGRDMKCQTTSMFNDESKLLSFGGASGSGSGSGSQSNNNNGKVQWRQQQDELHESSLLLSSYLDSHIIIPNNNGYNNNNNSMADHVNVGSGMVLSGGGLNQRESIAMGGMMQGGGYGSNGCSIDGLLNSVIKMERDDISYSDGDMGSCDMYPLGACM